MQALRNARVLAAPRRSLWDWMCSHQLPSAANVHLSAVEHKDSIVFLHAVQDGPASQSYGLQVAQLAGVPPAVIRAARKHLARLVRLGAVPSEHGEGA